MTIQSERSDDCQNRRASIVPSERSDDCQNRRASIVPSERQRRWSNAERPSFHRNEVTMVERRASIVPSERQRSDVTIVQLERSDVTIVERRASIVPSERRDDCKRNVARVHRSIGASILILVRSFPSLSSPPTFL